MNSALLARLAQKVMTATTVAGPVVKQDILILMGAMFVASLAAPVHYAIAQTDNVGK
jgi:hypothetical protein